VRRLLLLSALLLLPLGVAAEPADPVFQAMEAELARSMTGLSLEELAPPYFMALRVVDRVDRGASASFGALLGSTLDRPVRRPDGREVQVEVRVGSAERDNTNFGGYVSPSGVVRSWRGVGEMPLDEDVAELRRGIWLAADSAYKTALEELSRKEAALRNQRMSVELPDFATAEPAQVLAGPRSMPELAGDEVEELVRALSAIFREYEGIQSSQVSYRASTMRERYLNSEGGRYDKTRLYVRLDVSASTQATDGRRLSDTVALYGVLPGDLPERAELEARVRALADNLEGMREAPTLDRYIGPVLFEGAAAAEVFAQGFARHLVGARKPVDEEGGFALLEWRDNPLQERLGARVLPDWMSVTDDPSMERWGGTALLGHYTVDSDGVPAAPTLVVDGGRLRTMLTSRNPVPGVPVSTGNRRGRRVTPSNLVVRVDGGLGAAALRRQLLKRAKKDGLDHAIVIRRIENPLVRGPGRRGRRILGGSRNEPAVAPVVEAWRIGLDGSEERIRNVELRDLTPGSFRHLVAASRKAQVFHVLVPAPADPFARGTRASSIVIPDLLFEELTLRTPTEAIPSLPASEHPYFAD